MPSRGGSFRRILVATLAVAAGAALVGTWRAVLDLSSSDDLAEHGTEEIDASAAARSGIRTPRKRARAGVASEDAEQAPGDGTAPDAASAPPGNPAAADGDAASVAGDAVAGGGTTRRRPVADADSVLSATPDRDPATGTAPSVEPGRPPEVPLAEWVARGADAVHRSAELVGERKPAVEEGVPVSISGRVLESETGNPIAGARVVVSSTFYVRRYFYDHHLREVGCAETDGEGRWSIERLNVDPAHFGSGGRLYASITADAHAPALAVPIASVSQGIANRLPDVRLLRAAETLRGRVLDFWEGRPVVGARVYATGALSPITYPKDERAALFVGAPTAVTDAEGRFVLEGLGSGVQTISVHGPDDCIGWMQVKVPQPGEIAIGARQLRGRVEGKTVDERGEPVALVTVTCDDNSTHSFADGRFALENFRGDAVTIRFEHPAYVPVVRERVRDGTKGLVVRLEQRRAVVVLEVRDRNTGTPVSRVHLEFALAEGASPPPPTSPERLAADGIYRVSIPAGATSVSVASAGRRTEQIPLAALADGERVIVALERIAGD